jgi:hypothetical protein
MTQARGEVIFSIINTSPLCYLFLYKCGIPDGKTVTNVSSSVNVIKLFIVVMDVGGKVN